MIISESSRGQGLQSESALLEKQQRNRGTGKALAVARIVVLTPTVPSRLTVGGVDEKALLTMGISTVVGRSRSDILNQASADPSFDPAAHLMQELLLAVQGTPPSPPPLSLSIPREGGAARASLSRETFPAAAIADLLRSSSSLASVSGQAGTGAGSIARVLDVAVHDLGLLATGGKQGRLRPSAYATYRVLDAEGGVVQLNRSVLVNSAGPRVVGLLSGNGGPVTPAKDALKPDPACQFVKLPSDEAGTSLLRQCLNGALSQVARAIAADPVLRMGVDE
jgi:hypothetical protein